MRTFPLFIINFLTLACALTPSMAFAADEKSIIGGTVYLDRNRDGSPAGESGLHGVQVTLTGPKGTRRASTDAKGGYSFDELPAGQYSVSASAPANHQLTSPSTVSVKMDGKNASRSVDFGMATQAATPSPTPSPTARTSATATPTVTPTPSATNIGQRPNPLSSPGAIVDDKELTEGIPDEPARSPAPDGSPTVTATPTSTATPTATPNGGRGGVPDESVRLRAASLEPLRYAAGRDRLAAVKRWENGETVWLGVPFRTQMDGTYFSMVNCGPASLSMALAAFGLNLDPENIREYVNYLSGDIDADSGTSLDDIARVAREAGLRTLDLYSASGYRAWDLDLMRQHVAQGHPVITLTRYQSLPGNANSDFYSDHYVVITGLSGDDFIYNDPAFGSNAGYGLLISGPDLERAWSFSSIPTQSVALALDGDAQIPDWLRRRSETRTAPSGAPAVEEGATSEDLEALEAGSSIGEMPGDEELPEVDAAAMAQTQLELVVAPSAANQPLIADTESVTETLPEDTAEAIVLTSASEGPSAPRTLRLAEVPVLDPTLAMLFLALLGIFLLPALSRARQRP